MIVAKTSNIDSKMPRRRGMWYRMMSSNNVLYNCSYSLENTGWIPNHRITFTKGSGRRDGNKHTAIKTTSLIDCG